MPSPLVLVTGGARSGKSRWAESRIRELAGPTPLRYVATALPIDDEMAARITRHRADRGPGWRTIETPRDLAPALRLPMEGAGGTLVDCITIWLANRMLAGEDDGALLRATDELSAALLAQATPTVVVTNEVGAGIVPEHALARRFRDIAGIVNQRLASVASEVVLLACGLPLQLRGPAK